MSLTDELLAKKKGLEAERDALDAETAPLYAELGNLQAAAEKLRLQIKELNGRIQKIERPRRIDLSRDLVMIAKATSKAAPLKEASNG